MPWVPVEEKGPHWTLRSLSGAIMFHFLDLLLCRAEGHREINTWWPWISQAFPWGGPSHPPSVLCSLCLWSDAFTHLTWWSQWWDPGHEILLKDTRRPMALRHSSKWGVLGGTMCLHTKPTAWTYRGHVESHWQWMDTSVYLWGLVISRFKFYWSPSATWLPGILTHDCAFYWASVWLYCAWFLGHRLS